MPEILIPYKGRLLPCLYDLQDQELISQFSWYSDGRYAFCTINGKTTYMHRLVLGLSEGSTFQGDHIDHNGLNNQRSNLRICNRSENRRNSRKEKDCTSFYKGSYFESDRGLFHAQIGIGNKVFNLGRYSDERLAGKAYDKKALELFGSYACINFPSSREARQLQLQMENSGHGSE